MVELRNQQAETTVQAPTKESPFKAQKRLITS